LHYSYDEIVELEDYYGIRFNQIEKVPTRHSELMKMITKQTGEEPKTKDVAGILGLTQEAIRSRAFRDKEYSYAEVEKLKKYYDIPFVKPVKNAVDVKTTLQYIKTLIEDLEQSL
jgi:ornithine carbamoyltransferase